MNTELRKKAKNDFGKGFCQLMTNSVYGKTIENVTKHKDIKLKTTQRRRNYLESEPIYHTRKGISEHSLAIEMRKTKVINKPVYLDL